MENYCTTVALQINLVEDCDRRCSLHTSDKMAGFCDVTVINNKNHFRGKLKNLKSTKTIQNMAAFRINQSH